MFEGKFWLDDIDFCLGIFSRALPFFLGNLDLPSKLPRVSTLMVHPEKGDVWVGGFLDLP